MADKKCPKCNLWNSDEAEICDCGYNFTKDKVEYSISKEVEYNNYLQQNGKGISDIPILHKKIFIRLIISILLLALVNIPLKVPIKYYYCGASLLTLLIVIIINVYEREKYINLILRKAWKYPIIGLIIGFLFCQLIGFIFLSIKYDPQIGYSNSHYPEWFTYLFYVIILLCTFMGLLIGKRVVLDKIENMVRK